MKVSQSKIAKLSYDEKRSILYVETLNEAEMNTGNLADHDETVLKITGGKKHWALVDIQFLFYIDLEGVKFAAASDAYGKRVATAFYGGPLSNRLNAKLLQIQKNVTSPIGIFSSREEGLNWLKQVALAHGLV
ncbi:MAG: DUF7793 family protein [Bacteroidia bacterium]